MTAAIAQSNVASPYGWGMDALWEGLLSGRSAIQADARFDERGFISRQMALVPELNVEAGESRVRAMLRRLLRPCIGKWDKYTPVILATTVGEIEYLQNARLGAGKDQLANARTSELLRWLKAYLRLEGRGMVLSSACASSAAALGCAASMVERGEAEQVLVVACDAVSEFVYSGFSSLLGLSDQPARPFDKDRTGLTLGEGAAWALVQRVKEGEPAADTVRIAGWGNSADGVHMTAPDRLGSGLTCAIQKALARAGGAPEEIAMIAAHGTATVFSDAMECLAVRQCLPTPRPMFSIKGAVGHGLATAGLMQCLVLHQAMRAGIVPLTVGLREPDAQAAGWVHPTAMTVTNTRMALSMSAGFGGVNTALILRAGGWS